MRTLGLKGNDLLVFAVVHGFSQNGEGCYYGSLSHLAEICGIARRTVIDVLKRLTDMGLLKKTEIYRNGVKFCAYETSAKSARVVQNLHGGSAKSAPNNKEDNKEEVYININSLSNREGAKKSKTSFVAPTLEEVRAYCTERGNKVDAEAFVAFYTSKGWKVGSAPMKDWKAAVVTWEKREATKPARTAREPRRQESVYEHNMRVYDQVMGTNLHEQYYGKD